MIMRRATLTLNSLPSIGERKRLGFSVSGFELTMAERFGEEAARRFIEHFGGTEIYLPQKADADHPVSVAVGMDVLRWLIDTFMGGCELHIPTGVRSAWGLASIQLRQLIMEGAHTDRQIARLARCDVRSVRRARRSMCERGINVPPRQTSNPNEEPS